MTQETPPRKKAGILSGWEKDTSPFHRGEQELHARIGYKEQQEALGRRILRSFMPDQHREFFTQLPFMIIGSVDEQGWPWASIVFGEAGFVSTPTDRKMRISAKPLMGDPLAQNLRKNAPVSVLGIELPTRRRNRMNGVLATPNEGFIDIDVVQSFGNCPQYIQTRTVEFTRDPAKPAKIERAEFRLLDDKISAFIRNADTFFVASSNPKDDIRDTGGVDVNHRGGKPGFIKIDENTLTIPDYRGNNSFNTLGNFLINPKAGLLFVDFEKGDIVMLAGYAELLWDKTPEIEAMPGAQRAWRFKLDHGLHLKNASPIRWVFGEYSPKL